MSDIQTNTIKYKTGSAQQLKPSGNYAVRIYDVFVSGSTVAPTWIKFTNGNEDSDANEYIIFHTYSQTGVNSAASSTNMFSVAEGYCFNNGCFVNTGANFSYASITIGVDMA